MEKAYRNALFISIALMIGSHYLALFHSWSGWWQLESCAALVVIFLTPVFANTKQICYVVALVGIGIFVYLFWPGATAGQAFAALRSIVLLVNLIVLVPLLSLIFVARGHIEALAQAVLRRVQRPSQFYGGVVVLAHLVGSMLLIGSVPILFGILRRVQLTVTDHQRRLSTAILHGFSLATLWTPGSALLGMSLAIGTTWSKLWPLGAGLALGGLGLAILCQTWPEREKPGDVIKQWGEAIPLTAEHRLVWEFVFLLVSYLALVVITEAATSLRLLDLVPLVAIVFLFAAHAVFRLSPRTVVQRAAGQLANALPAQAGLLSVLLAAGFVGGALADTGLGARLFEFYQAALGYAHLNLLAGIPLLVVLMGFLGFDPLPIISIVITSLQGTALDVSPVLLAAATLVGGTTALFLTPFAAPVLVVSALTGRDPLVTGPGWNWRFGLCFLFGAIALMELLHWL
ncbi:MAG TPA: hypothetical protein GXZ96_02700 [Firmicutes bacterium]|nr:hypothetical protein [Bacillota bacterium]